MKRVKSACLIQTLHFILKEGLPREQAIPLVQAEVEQYKARMDRTHTRYRILSEQTLEDGSILLEIRKQYNASPVGHYLD